MSNNKPKTQWGKWQGRNPEKNKKRMWIFLILAIFFLFMGLFGKDLIPRPESLDTDSSLPVATVIAIQDDMSVFD